MWQQVISKIWRKIPKQIRRFGVLLTQPRFTVTAGIIVTDKENRVLLLHHRFRGGSGWGLPGGFLNPREAPEIAIRRELVEEIGLEVENLQFAFARTLHKYQQVEIYFRGTPKNKIGQNNIEITCAEWFSLNSLPPELSEDQREIIRLSFDT